MLDSYTESSSQSFFSRLIDSIKGVIFGMILIIGSIVLLCWNEGRAVKTAQSLKEGSHVVISVSADSLDPNNEGKLIHVTGKATTAGTVKDATFMVNQNALRLNRKVEMFQWTEKTENKTQKKLGGGTETQTTYSYTKEWSEKLIRSSEFKHAEGHENPAAMIAEEATMIANDVKIGALSIPTRIVAKMHGDEPLSLTEADVTKLPNNLKDQVKLASNTFYLGADPTTPSIGDQRVTFTILKPSTFSLLARQSGSTLAAYPTKTGRDIERVESGDVTAATMFVHAEKENTITTWILRIVATILMALGVGLVLSPIATLMDVIPILGDIIGMGTTLAAIMTALITSTVVIAIAWFTVRPWLSAGLVALAIGGMILTKRRATKKIIAAS